MVAPIDLINRALVLLGEQPVMSLDQPCKPARVAGVMYEAALESELAGHPWHFAKKRQYLAPMTSQEPPEGGVLYRLPSDWLHSIALLDSDGDPCPEAVHEGQGIRLPNGSPVILSYIAKIDDPSAYPALFKDVLVLRLAMDMAESLTQSAGKREAVQRAYQLALQRAKHANGWLASPARVPESNWIGMRS